MLICHLYIFGNKSVQIVYLFFNCVGFIFSISSFESSFYILDTSLILDIFVNICFQSLACILIL